MPRKPRFFVAGVPVHIVQRGRSREPVFFEPGDFRRYLDWLRLAATRYRCSVHAYVLMTNHVHILATPDSKSGPSRMMQFIGGNYTPYVNYRNDTTGSIWEGRFKASLVEDERYLFTCMRYIELNPVRAHIVDAPEQYRWSSYHSNALGNRDSLITPHPLYRNLGPADNIRQTRYRALFDGHFAAELAREIQSACESGTPFGDSAFRDTMERNLRMKTVTAKRGRPSKSSQKIKGV